jgi:hypothetical protein
MLYPFKCKQCEEIKEIFAYMDEICDIQNGLNGREKPKCEKCDTAMIRVYTVNIKKFHGKITPLEVKDTNGKVHRLNQNLWRN